MSIYSKQYQKIISSEILKYLMLGSLPNINDISQRIGRALGNKNNITYKYLPQAFKAVFQNELYNKALKQIKFDIDLLQEEIIDQFSESANRLNYADLYHKINSQELNKLKSQLELLLFTVKDADFYFDGAVDTFSDTSKTNTTLSTRDIIDLSEQCLALPYGGNNTKRIDITREEVNTAITLSKPNIVLESRPIPGTFFYNVFNDTLSAWGYEVITSSNEPIEMSFTFPLRKATGIESEFFISRFEVTPHSPKKQKVFVTTSNDDVNYISIIGYENGIDLEDQKRVYALDFETTLIEYVKITLGKTEADEEMVEEGVTKYKYIFGLKRFAAYQTGRLTSGSYISKPFKFDSKDAIGKVSIDASQHLPPGCQAQFYVAGVSKGTQGSYIPITPINNDTSTGTSNIIVFNSTENKSIKFNIPRVGNDAPVAYGSAFQGKTFYRIGPKFTGNPIFGTGKLYRGFNNWYRDYTGSFEIINVSDNYVSFEHTDLEAMYTTITQAPVNIFTSIGSDGIRRARLRLEKKPYYDNSRGHALKPQPGTQNSSLDTRPNYAIYKILQKTTNARQVKEFSTGSTRTVLLPSANFILESNNPNELPELRYLTGQLLVKNQDYVFEVTDIGGKSLPTGVITIPDGSALLDSSGNMVSYALQFRYNIDPDITHKVSRIEGNDVVLDNSSNTTSDSLEVTYRYIPTAPSQIIKASIRVMNLPSTSAGRIMYLEGRDYVVDPNTGAIQRIPNGNISTKGSVYVSFSYRGSSSNVQTFTTWCFISSTGGSQIKFDLDPSTKKNRLIVDENGDESFYVNSKEGLINLTKSTGTPLLPYGWVQFIVRSKDPSLNQTYGTNLIDQVIQLKDINKKKVFRAFNFYFNEITAFREPISEKSLNHLKVNTLLSDHSSFAIDNVTDPFSAYIVLNFKPNETSELYQKIPTEDFDETNPPATSNEEFRFDWSEKVSTETTVDSLVVKIDLIRNQGIDGALTPKVFQYQLRVGS